MKSKHYMLTVKVLIFVIDFLLINVAFIVSRQWIIESQVSTKDSALLFLIFSLIWVVVGFFFKVYRIHSLSLIRSISSNLLNAFLVHALLMVALSTTVASLNFSVEFMISVYVLAGMLITGARVVYKLALKYVEFSGFDQRNVIIVGVNRSGKAIYDFFTSHVAEGYHFKGFFDDDTPQEFPELNLMLVGKTSAVKTFCKQEQIDEIYFTLPLTHQNESFIRDLSNFADNNFIYLRIAPDFSKVVNENYDVVLINSVPILTTRKEPLGVSINLVLKRLFDIGFSLAVILILFPILLPVIALAIRIDSRGPIIFKQLRPGKKNKLFECFKFRTMQVNHTTELQATKNDSRVTRIGKFLRKTNLDELPQFFNVLLGDMSVVGPRPNMISQLEEYSKTIKHYKVRHFISPGITGYAQVNGLRGETREPGLMEKRVQFDVLYLENWSMALDLKIIFLTVWNMVRGEKNAY